MGNSCEYWVINRRGNGCFGERRKESSKPTSDIAFGAGRIAEQQNCRFLNVKIVWLEAKGVFINNRKRSDVLSSCFLDFRHLTSDSLITYLLLQLLCYRHHHTIRIFKKYNN